MAFSENLRKLPPISHIAALRLLNVEGIEMARIENEPGSAGSVAVYNHLAQTYGAITAEAAKKGLELYAEHAEEARVHPGKHPNIDRLIAIAEGAPTLKVKPAFAV